MSWYSSPSIISWSSTRFASAEISSGSLKAKLGKARTGFSSRRRGTGRERSA